GACFPPFPPPSSPPEPPAEAVAASADIVRYLTGLLARKRAAPGDDLVTDLVRAADQGGALSAQEVRAATGDTLVTGVVRAAEQDGARSEQEMLSTIFQLVVAGHDTTTSLIGNG